MRDLQPHLATVLLRRAGHSVSPLGRRGCEILPHGCTTATSAHTTIMAAGPGATTTTVSDQGIRLHAMTRGR